MAEKKIYQAIDAFYVGGQFINRGDTVVGGHPLLKGRTKLFQVFKPTFDVTEEPKAEEPEVVEEPEAEA
jgi:hypothetical protein